jgi:hypothetical protein
VPRPAPFDRLRRIEELERAADDLGGGVALQPFGAAVPGEDRAIRREHEDRIVDDALDQQAEAMVLGIGWGRALVRIVGLPERAGRARGYPRAS